MRRACVDKVTEQDMFGHTVNLNFDKRGDAHNTFCGGFFSTVVRIFLCLYVYLLIEKLVTKGNDTDFSFFGLVELETLGVIPYESMDITVFHLISQQDKTKAKLTTVDAFAKYFYVEYVQLNNDYNTRTFDKIRYPVKQCEASDFGSTERHKELFDTWKGYFIVCPDLGADGKLNF